MKKMVVLFIAILLLIAPAMSAAQSLQNAAGNLNSFQTGGLSSDLGGITQNVVKAIFWIVGTVFLLLSVYGGIVWIKAAGREEEVKRAKKIIVAAVIGLVVVFASYAISNFVMNRVQGIETTE